MSTAISPLAPKSFAKMPPIDGVRIATAEAGIKYKDRTDLMVMAFDEGTEVAGVFTRSKCPSAPVDLCRANLAGGKARVLVEDKRAKQPPAFEEVKDQVRSLLVREKYFALVKSIRDAAKVEIADPALKTAVEQLEKGQ